MERLGPKTTPNNYASSVQMSILMNAAGILPGLVTFYAQQIGYASYATPTDMFSLRNPVASGKVLVPRNMAMLCHSTAAALMKFYWYRRASLNTGGTPTDLVPVKYDTAQADAVGVPRTYGAAPAIVDAATPINFHWNATTVPTTAPGSFNSSGMPFGWALNSTDFPTPLVLRPGQELAINLLGAGLPIGFTAVCALTWMELDA